MDLKENYFLNSNMEFKENYDCLNISPTLALNMINEYNYRVKCLNDHLNNFTILDIMFDYFSVYDHNKKILDKMFKLYNIVINRKKIIKEIIILQRRYKNYLYSPESNYGKKLIKNGENKLQEFT